MSIIVCSRNPELLEKLRKNVQATIGLQEYEFLPIDNHSNQYSLSAAYNIAAEKARHPYLCFVHEDIQFLTRNWGQQLIEKLNQQDIGAIGVAGSTLLPETGLWASSMQPFVQGKIVHKFPDHEQIEIFSMMHEDTEVVVLDGVCIATTKEICRENPFDTSTFDGFHFYDIDFCIRLAQKYKLLVTNILLQHASGGGYNEAWQRYQQRFLEKHRFLLPFTKLPSLPASEGPWKTLPYNSKLRYPKVLVGCPTSFHKEYCLQEYANAVKFLTYPQYDTLLVDNSPDDAYLKKLKAAGLPAIKGPYHEGARDRIVASRNLLAQCALEKGYDYFLSLEQDVIPPKDIIQRMLVHGKKVLTGIYFNSVHENNESKLTPLAYKISKLYPNKLPDMRPLSLQEISSNALLQIVSAGLGCLLIHRDLLRQTHFRYEGQEAFDDRFFFLDIYNLKIPAYADTSIKCKHLILNRPYPWKDIKK